MTPHPKLVKDLSRKRLQLVCTGMVARRHGPVVLVEYWRPVTPKRPDLEKFVQRTDFVSLDGKHPRCGRCGFVLPITLDPGRDLPGPVHIDPDILAALELATPGAVLRYDVQAGRLLR